MIVTLKEQIKLLKDLKRQLEIISFRYYNSVNQTILLNLIFDEIEKWPELECISKDLYIALSTPEKLATEDIRDLCLLYRQVILYGNSL